MLIIIVLIIARIGFKDIPYTFAAHSNSEWITLSSVCSYTFIYLIFIISYLLGDVVPIKLVRLNGLPYSGYGLYIHDNP